MKLGDIFRTWRLQAGFVIGELYGGLWTNAQVAGPAPVVLTYGPAIALSLAGGNAFTVTITDNVAFLLSNPTNPPTGRSMVFTVTFRNTSGGAHGAGTFGTDYQVSAALAAIATGQQRTMGFLWTGTEAVEIWRTAADVPV